jgi:nucleoid DNA-binding protein
MAKKKVTAKKPVGKKPAVAKKTISKKTISKKAVVKKSVVRKKAAAKKPPVAKKAPATSAAAPRPKSIAKRQTKLQIIQAIAEDTGLERKQVAEVFSALGVLIQRHMQRRGSGEFSVPDTGVKIRRVRKKAVKARMGRNPATGEAVEIAAKPAHNVIRLSALKALKETLE